MRPSDSRSWPRQGMLEVLCIQISMVQDHFKVPLVSTHPLDATLTSGAEFTESTLDQGIREIVKTEGGTMISIQNVVLAGTLAVVVACTPREQLVSKLDQCTLTHGYDPNQTAGIAENALAPSELSWRQCAYDAVRAYAKANPSLADLYLQLIDDDIEMTTAIQQGTLTRSQRRARLQTLIADIRAAEDAQIETAADRGKDGHNPPLVLLYRDELSNLDKSIQGFH